MMEEKLFQLQRTGLCDQRVCAAISHLIEDLIWELPLASNKEKIIDIEREDKYTLAKFRVLKQATETPEAGKASFRGGKRQTDNPFVLRRRTKHNSPPTDGNSGEERPEYNPYLPQRRNKRNSPPKHENSAKNPSAKRTPGKELAKKSSAKSAGLTQDALIERLERKCLDIEQDKVDQDALFTQLQQKYQDIKQKYLNSEQDKVDQDTLFTQLQQEYQDIKQKYRHAKQKYWHAKQKNDAAKELIELLQRRLKDSDRGLEELQKEITESKRKDLEIYLLREELLEAQKETPEFRGAEHQKAMGNTIDGDEIPTHLPSNPSRQRTASPEVQFFSQRKIKLSGDNSFRRYVLINDIWTQVSDLERPYDRPGSPIGGGPKPPLSQHHQVPSPVSQHPQVLPPKRRAADDPITSGLGKDRSRKDDSRRKAGKRLRPLKDINYEIKLIPSDDSFDEEED